MLRFKPKRSLGRVGVKPLLHIKYNGSISKKLCRWAQRTGTIYLET